MIHERNFILIKIFLQAERIGLHLLNYNLSGNTVCAPHVAEDRYKRFSSLLNLEFLFFKTNKTGVFNEML